MLRSTKVQMIAVLAIGALFGYAAASAKLDVFRTGIAASPPKGQLVAMADPQEQAAGVKVEGQNGKQPAQEILRDKPVASRAKLNGRRSGKRMGGIIRHPT
jgi:hypothetical protein